MYLAAGVYLSEVPDSLPPPMLHTIWIHTPVLIHTWKGGGGRWRKVGETVRGALVHKRDRYQHDWLCLQSINSSEHQLRRHLGFGVFIDIWSMRSMQCCRVCRLLPPSCWPWREWCRRLSNSGSRPTGNCPFIYIFSGLRIGSGFLFDSGIRVG